MRKAVRTVIAVWLGVALCFGSAAAAPDGGASGSDEAAAPNRIAGMETKIVLTPSMVTNESGLGDATLLVDEQTLSGDPANGTGGAPVTSWQAGWNVSLYPAHAYIDLGQLYDLTSIYLRDTYDMYPITISAGSPGNWTELFTDPLTGWMTWNAHPVDVKTRYVRVTLHDPRVNMSEIVLYGTPADGGGDTTAPAAVTDLAATSSTASTVSLTWTAPGDDGMTGTASSYEIRYSTSDIKKADWASATQAVGAPAPAPAGTAQSMTVTGLSPATTYYFALRAKDGAGNEADLSNVVSKATAPVSPSTKIPLTASMILNEATNGDATLLVDEQDLAGDPKAGAGGHPVTYWNPGYFEGYYPASAVIDLGTDYQLTDVYLYDGSGGGKMSVLAGTPFNWTHLFDDPLSQQNKWIAHPINITTRYVQVKFDGCCRNMHEIVLYGTPLGTPAPPPASTPHTPPTMDQLMGVNAFIDDPQDKMQAAGFVREYHNWFWDEGDAWDFQNHSTVYPGYPNNANKFNPSYGGGGGWNFDAYYQSLKGAGLTVVPAIQGSVDWLSDGFGHKPVSSGKDALLPSSYAEHADHMFQFAARYGSTVVADSKLKLAAGQARSTGLNTLQYFEDWNEQDANWSGRMSYFTPYEYAAMASADYDGHQGAMGNTYGVKNADPNAKMVMGGLADPDLDYIKALKFWSDWNRRGSLPFDVVNVHLYNNKPSGSGYVGISPEEGKFKEQLEQFVDYRNRYLPGKEMWITEFGYDTHPGSDQRSPEIGPNSQFEVQAQWLVRSYLAAAAAGVDKAVMFMLRDEQYIPEKFQNSGLITNKATGSVPKISWYYVYTLKNRLSGMRYLAEENSGNANVKIYKFKSANSSSGAYVIWCPTSNNTTVNGYQLQLAGTSTSATQVALANGNTNGVQSNLTISGGKVTVNVSERPIFVMVDNIQ
ncbi:fibronectin type III domain-containing protein [Paenibacillus sp. GCM10027626]|uniref:fibronectin type III domain-containing protein n=1 Tax=Paenibacillus sp. GCM10027626 TaxID=3273411 RepID=UPI00362BBEE5